MSGKFNTIVDGAAIINAATIVDGATIINAATVAVGATIADGTMDAEHSECLNGPVVDWAILDCGYLSKARAPVKALCATVALSERSYARDNDEQVDVYFGAEDKANDVTGTSGSDLILTGALNDLITGGKGRNFINAGDGEDEVANDNRLIVRRLVA